MSAFLDWLEKILTWFFALAFGMLLLYLGWHWNSHRQDNSDPWLRAQKLNTVDAYLAFLRQCQKCPQEKAAKKALDELQRVSGLLARLNQQHLPEMASITLPVFSPDGRTVLASGGRGPDFWHADAGTRIAHSEKTFARRGGRLQVDALDFAPDGRRMAAGTAGREYGHLLMWDLTTETLVADREVDGVDIKAVLFSPDGAWLGWRGDGPVGLWNPVSGRFLRSTHAGVQSIAFGMAEDGRPLFMTAAGRSLVYWDASTLELLRERMVNTDRALLGFSRDGRVLAYTDGRVLEIWDPVTLRQVAALRDLEGDISAFCRETETGRLLVGTKAGRMYLWNPALSPVPLAHVAAHEGPIEALSCGAEGRVVSTSWDGAKVWSLSKLLATAGQERGARHF